jgi:hypothetical protein
LNLNISLFVSFGVGVFWDSLGRYHKVYSYVVLDARCQQTVKTSRPCRYLSTVEVIRFVKGVLARDARSLARCRQRFEDDYPHSSAVQD